MKKQRQTERNMALHHFLQEHFRLMKGVLTRQSETAVSGSHALSGG